MKPGEKRFSPGDRVYFNDPDDGIANGWYILEEINGEVYRLTDNSNDTVIEAFEHELNPEK
jgi:hypothetical protein